MECPRSVVSALSDCNHGTHSVGEATFDTSDKLAKLLIGCTISRGSQRMISRNLKRGGSGETTNRWYNAFLRLSATTSNNSYVNYMPIEVHRSRIRKNASAPARMS